MGARRRGLRRSLVAALGWSWLAGLGMGSIARAVDFTEVARFDISSRMSATEAAQGINGIGSHGSSVAWKNGKLYVAGYNQGVRQYVGIAEVLNATSPGVFAAPSFGPAFSRLRVSSTNGFSGLALSSDGSQLAAAFFNGISPAPDGLQLYSTLAAQAPGGNVLIPRWRTELAAGSGVEFDPGFDDGASTTGSGVAWVSTVGTTPPAGSLLAPHRRMLQHPLDGVDIQTPANGMDWYPLEMLTPPDLSYRKTTDLAFDPATGDMYTRTGNDVIVARRQGGNSVHSQTVLVNEDDFANMNNRRLAFLNTDSLGGMIIYNDRPGLLNPPTPPPTQEMVDVVKLVSSTGIELTPTFEFLGGYEPAAGAGWYDFDFDAVSQTLALLDTSNHQVHIFSLGSATLVADSDFDDDGDVDGADFLTWQRNLGVNAGSATHGEGDADGDDHVAGDDLAAWREQFGAGGGGGAAPVPEPSGAVLGFFAAAGMAALSRKRRTAISRG